MRSRKRKDEKLRQDTEDKTKSTRGRETRTRMEESEREGRDVDVGLRVSNYIDGSITAPWGLARVFPTTV